MAAWGQSHMLRVSCFNLSRLAMLNTALDTLVTRCPCKKKWNELLLSLIRYTMSGSSLNQVFQVLYSEPSAVLYQVLCCTKYSAKYCTVSNTALCQVLHCSKYCSVPSTALYQVLHCTKYCTVQSTALYQVLHCTKYCTVPSTALYQVLHCTKYCSVCFGWLLLCRSIFMT